MIFALLFSLSGFSPVAVKATQATPAKPKISVKANGTSIDVTIKKTKNADDYSIYIKGSKDDKFYIIGSVEANKDGKTKHTITGLTVDDEYSVKVRAYNGLTPSKYSAVKKAVIDTRPDSPDWIAKLGKAKNTDQLFVVGQVYDSTAYVSMHEKNKDGKWKTVMTTPGYIGLKGLGKTKEGDMLTPVGDFSFNAAFGIADDPGCALPYQKVTEDDYWSGDPREGYGYNTMVNIKDLPDLDKDNSEHIIDYTVHYQYCLNISYNEECTPGAGSAIFLHCLGPYKPYTMGCVAIPEECMIDVLKAVNENCVVVIDSLQNLSPETYNSWEIIKKNSDNSGAGKTEPSVTLGEDGVRLSDDSSDFVLLTDVVPDAILEIRYYSTYNFVGDRIDGYEEPLAFLTKEAAAALKKVSDELNKKGYRLKIFDAYRPQKAVTHFMNWALDLKDTRMKKYFYPELEKDVLFPQGYIAEHSGHSRGSTVDLTLFDMTTEKEVDMGGTFDYFGELSHPDYKNITDEQYANRMLLREVMLKYGFKPLEEEWWHFTLEDEPYPDTYFTFPVNSKSIGK